MSGCGTDLTDRTPQTAYELIAGRAEQAADRTAVLAPGRTALTSGRLLAQVEALHES